MSLQPPAVCNYQNVNLSVELTDQSDNSMLPIMTQVYNGSHPPILFVFKMEQGLVRNRNYSLVVSVTSAVETVSTSMNFSK